MIVYDMATKALDIKSFPQHNIAGVISGNTFIVLFSQEKPLWWKEINTHTHTHTHTQIYIYTHTSSMFLTTIKTFKFTFSGSCEDKITAMSGLKLSGLKFGA